MPLYPSAKDLIRVQIEEHARGNTPGLIAIGTLTDTQMAEINASRGQDGLPPITDPTLIYKGAHHYESRVTRDGYAFDDLFLQIEAALSPDSIARAKGNGTTLTSPKDRKDGYGYAVRDVAVLEVNSRLPRAEVFSVIPKGDKFGKNRGKGKKKAP